MSTRPDASVMQELIEYAYDKMLSSNAYPFCAFVVKDGVVVSRGFNERINLYGDRTTHGEMEAIRKAMKALKTGIRLEGYQLFTTCEPCLACFDSVLYSGIRRLVYSVDHHDFPDYFNDHPYTVDDFEKNHPNTIEIIKQVNHDDGLNLFKVAKRKYGW